MTNKEIDVNVNKMKQTAVEWLFTQFQRTGIYPKYSIDNEEINLKQDLIHTLIEQAKAMEKEQIMDAHSQGYSDGYRDNGNSSIDYYYETFKSE